MISFNTFFKQKMTRFFILIFSGLLIIFNVGFFVFSIVQYNRHIERQEDSFIEMMGHLIVLENIDSSITYVEHYDHTHGVSIIYYNPEHVVLYQSEQLPDHDNRLQITDDSGNLLGEVVLDYQRSVVGNELTVGLISFNLFSLIVFMSGLWILYQYINRQYQYIVDDMNCIGQDHATFRFSDMKIIHDRYIDALESEKELQAVHEHYVKVLAHDVKTPLTVIKAYIEGVQSKRIDFDEKVFKDMLNEVKVIENLIPQLMATSLKQISKTQDISIQIKEILSRLGDAFKTKNIKIIQQIDHFDCLISNEDIKRLTEHLIFNAFYYSDANREIHVILNNKTRQFIVKDKGIGMSKETLDKIYKGSYRDKKAQQYHQTGSGVGLQIVFDIVKRIGAQIEIESKENVGTTITVTFSE